MLHRFCTAFGFWVRICWCIEGKPTANHKPRRISNLITRISWCVEGAPTAKNKPRSIPNLIIKVIQASNWGFLKRSILLLHRGCTAFGWWVTICWCIEGTPTANHKPSRIANLITRPYSFQTRLCSSDLYCCCIEGVQHWDCKWESADASRVHQQLIKNTGGSPISYQRSKQLPTQLSSSDLYCCCIEGVQHLDCEWECSDASKTYYFHESLC
jgi:hypothetical protein